MTAGVALVEELGQQLGVAVGAEHQLGEVVGADRDARRRRARRSARGGSSTDGTSAITQSSKPGRSSRPASRDHVAAGGELARRAHERQHHVEVRVSRVPDPADRRRARAGRRRARACSAARRGSRSSGSPLRARSASPPSQAAELVGAEVDRPVGDRPRREARRRTSVSALRHPLDELVAAALLDQQAGVAALERLDHHQLGAQQADAVDVERRGALDLRGLGEVDQQLGRGDAGPHRRWRQRPLSRRLARPWRPAPS